MGTVYLAEQRQPIRRTVALKVIKRGMDTRAVVARFALALEQPIQLLNQAVIRKMKDGDGNYLWQYPASDQVWVFDAATLQTVTTLRGFMFGVHSSAFSPDGTRLAIIEDHAGIDQHLIILNVATGAAHEVPRSRPTRSSGPPQPPAA